MYQSSCARRSGLSLALVLVSMLGCSGESNPARQAEAEKLALEVADGAPPDAGGGGQADAELSCIPRDATCDAIDDDCDGRFDEDFPTRCLFGSVAVVCVGGGIISESCDDGNPCTVDSCGTRGCAHAAVSCDDHNPCTVDQCGASGCGSAPAPGLACDDGDRCTTNDACNAAGSCGPGMPINVDDGDPCTADTCDPRSGVTHVPATGVSCDDGDACSQADACTADGSCVGVPRADIADGDPCTADSCDTASGVLTHTVVPVGTSCSDGDACNGAETCEALPEIAFTVDARSSFYRVDNGDAFQPPRIVRLSDAGVRAGQRVHFRTQGRYASPAVARAGVVFSSDAKLLARTELHRVTGAIQSAAPPFVTGKTYFEQRTTDISEDFQVTVSDLQVEIPAGAQFMFLGNFDTYYADNSGSIQVLIRTETLACKAGAPPVVDDGSVCTADACDPSSGVSHEPVTDGTTCTFVSRPGACVDGECVACSAQPEACQLPNGQ
jgi:hypothetical protein